MGDIALTVGIHLEKANNLLNARKTLVKIFAGHIVPKLNYLGTRTSPKSPSKKIVYVQKLRTALLSESAITARSRHSVLSSPKWHYKTHWLAWCNQVIELLNQTIEN